MKALQKIHICLLTVVLTAALLYPAHSKAEIYPGLYEVSHHGFWVVMNRPESCMECHDGVLGPNITQRTTGCSSAIGTTHPVFTKYPTRQKGKKIFVPLAEIEKSGLMLINGKIVCTTCHNLLNPAKPHLAISNEQSRLCRSCHVR